MRNNTSKKTVITCLYNTGETLWMGVELFIKTQSLWWNNCQSEYGSDKGLYPLVKAQRTTHHKVIFSICKQQHTIKIPGCDKWKLIALQRNHITLKWMGRKGCDLSKFRKQYSVLTAHCKKNSKNKTKILYTNTAFPH